MKLVFICFLWLFYVHEGQCDETEQCDDPNAFDVIFENLSGSNVELYTDDKYSVTFIAKLENTESVTTKALIGQNFYFTPTNSGGSKERYLYQKVIKKSTKTVVLYSKKKMKIMAAREDVGCVEDGTQCKIIFENKSGKAIKVYWQGGAGGVFQGLVRNNDEMLQHTHIGHTFYFTPNTNSIVENE
eukprot:747688_1